MKRIVEKWLSTRTHKAGVGSSIPAYVTMKTPLVWKATGNHLIKSTSLEKLRALSLVSTTLEIDNKYISIYIHTYVYRHISIY